MHTAKLTGIVPPLITPLAGRDALDTEGLDRLVEHVIAGGVSGVFVLGTTGEGPGLSYRLRREVIDRACQAVAGRVPVLVGVTDPAFVETLAMAKHAADAGATAVVVAPPFYYPAGQEEMLDYLRHLAAELPLPMYLYNMPNLTKITFEVDTVRRAMDLPGVIGLKDSSQSMIYFNRVRELAAGRDNWSLLVGPEELLAQATLLGGNGGVCGGANIFPNLYVDLFNSASEGDLPRTRALHQRVLEVSGTLYSANRQTSSIMKSIKCALSCLGICQDTVAEPFSPFTGSDRERIARLVGK